MDANRCDNGTVGCTLQHVEFWEDCDGPNGRAAKAAKEAVPPVDDVEPDRRRYMAAAHAVQSGVAMEHSRGGADGQPKHLRTGVNIALRDHASLVGLLIAKGVFTEAEYTKVAADGMEAEVRDYEQRLSEMLGAKVTLA